MTPDGSIRHLHDLVPCLRDEAGNQEVVGAIMDITERRVAEEAIRRSEAYLAEAQRLTHTGSWAAGPTLERATYWSEETFGIFERSSTAGLANGKELREWTHPDDREEYGKRIGEALNAREHFS